MTLALGDGLPVRVAVVLWLVVMGLVLLPLLAVVVPPLHDYPFHLARADAIATLLGQVGHGTFYRLGSFALANEAMDVVTAGLTAMLAPVQAGRVFLGLVQVLLLGGTAALHFALHRRLSVWPLVAGFFLYNGIFLYGFTNYLFGVAVMLWAVAVWVGLARCGWAVRLGFGTVAAVVLVFCHLTAFGLFAVMLAGLALRDAMGRRQGGFWAQLLLPGVPVVIRARGVRGDLAHGGGGAAAICLSRLVGVEAVDGVAAVAGQRPRAGLVDTGAASGDGRLAVGGAAAGAGAGDANSAAVAGSHFCGDAACAVWFAVR